MEQMQILQKRQKKRVNERGSALFIILIAVMLFAALSYAVASIMRSGNPEMITQEKAALYANEITSYGRALRQAVQTVKIGGCTDMDVSFENALVGGYDHASVAPVKCRVFEAAGGSMTYVLPAADWLDLNINPAPTLQGQWFFPANLCVPGTGRATAGSACNTDSIDNEALVLILPYIRKDICREINKAAGIPTTPDIETGNAWLAAATKFRGVSADGEQLDQDGRITGCFQGSGANTPPAGTYHFFQVLLPR